MEAIAVLNSSMMEVYLMQASLHRGLATAYLVKGHILGASKWSRAAREAESNAIGWAAR